MEGGIIGTILLILNGLITYKGFRDRSFFEEHIFEVDKILIGRDYKRLISSGFLHVDWIHFAFNMIALFAFSDEIENKLGMLNFVLLYFASLIGGNLLALFIHRNHGNYRAVGASGAISGVIFSYIILYPNSSVQFLFIPLDIKSWLIGLVFVAFSIWGIRSQKGNIGHDAHLGGAIIGVLTTIAFYPSLLVNNWWIVLAILIPTFVFLYLIVTNPSMLLLNDSWGTSLKKSAQSSNIVKKFNQARKAQLEDNQESEEEELDRLLDKIGDKGIDGLTKRELRRLEELRGRL